MATFGVLAIGFLVGLIVAFLKIFQDKKQADVKSQGDIDELHAKSEKALEGVAISGLINSFSKRLGESGSDSADKKE